MAKKEKEQKPQPAKKPAPDPATKRRTAAQGRATAQSRTPTTRGGTGRATKPATPPTAAPKGKATPSKQAPASKKKWTMPQFRRPTMPPRPQFQFNAKRQAIVGGLGLVFFPLFIALSLLSSNQGKLTANLIDLIWLMFGWGSGIALVGVGVMGLWLIGWGMERPWRLPALRVLGGGVLAAVLLAFASQIAYLADNGLPTFDAVLAARAGGGLIGNLLAESLIAVAGHFGTIMMLVLVGAVAASLLTGLSWQDVQAAFQSKPEPQPAQTPLPLEQFAETQAAVATAAPPTAVAGDEVLPWVEPPAPPAAVEAEKEGLLKKLGGNRRRTKAADPHAPAAPQPLILGREEKQALSWALPSLESLLNKGSDYVENHEYMRQQANIIEETLKSFGAPVKIVDTLPGPTLIQYCVEPLYIEMRNGKRTKVKVGKIASLADDLALALSARSVRVEAPVPGKAYVGIEVPNEQKTLVSLRDVMESDAFAKVAKKSPLAIGLGQDVSGHAIALDMTKMPHILVAGATGSGKSVCVNTIIASLLLQNTPEDLQLVMVDPKRVELTGYNGIPHLAAPVVVEMERVVGTLQWALREMDKRYRSFAEISARNIVDYNGKVLKKGEPKLPYIVIIIDELADLMMLAPEDTERGITRLAQMARATGIHMIIATQRPSVDVVTGLIKANFPARIAFAVASSTDSRVVLDTTGAERLLGAGDMLFQDPNAPAPVRMQGCFVSDAELNQLIDYWKQARRFGHVERETNFIKAATDVVSKAELDQAVWDVDEDPQRMIKLVGEPAPAPEILPTVTSQMAEPPPPPPPAPPLKRPLVWSGLAEQITAAQEEALADVSTDALYPDAVALVQKHGRASTSLLQRHFRIGYTRAARLMDYMEDQGLIGAHPGQPKARPVFGEFGAAEEEVEELAEAEDEETEEEELELGEEADDEEEDEM